MIIDCIADLHGYFPKLEGGDLLIAAGDFTARDTSHEYSEFLTWLMNQNYRKKIYIAGNHDNLMTESVAKVHYHSGKECFEYLCDSGTEFEGFKIWGSPWTKTFPGMNPRCKAFTMRTEKELDTKWALIPEDTDILITHGPPFGILDKNDQGFECGSVTLLDRVRRIRPRLHVFGHIHEAYDKYGLFMIDGDRRVDWYNCSYVNERYQPVNSSVRIELLGNSE